jgi:hypothetical protein
MVAGAREATSRAERTVTATTMGTATTVTTGMGIPAVMEKTVDTETTIRKMKAITSSWRFPRRN